MMKDLKRGRNIVIAGQNIRAGETRDIALNVSETYTGHPIQIPVRVIRAKKKGPTVFVTGAVHGNELTGLGIIRRITAKTITLLRGTLILVPVVNIFGFENHSRYLPDRRDLNRCFPGSESGNLALRLAHVLYQDIVTKCDVGLDLHSAAAGRTNFPQIRADFSVPSMEPLALAFGCELVIDKKAHPNSLRASSAAVRCRTLLYEAGEVLKFEPSAVEIGVRGVFNVLRYLNMLGGKPIEPAYQTTIQKTQWIRSDTGGLLQFLVSPGDLIHKGEILATNEKIFLRSSQRMRAPIDGIVLGMTTLPAVKPGEPICHLATPSIPLSEISEKIKKVPKTLHRRAQKEMASNIPLSRSVRPR
jgi:uncharacterized protein